MDDKVTVLYDATRKAVDNGFHWLDFFSSAENPFTNERPVFHVTGTFDEVIKKLVADNTYPVLIFNHRFAKALWGSKNDVSLALSGMDTTVPWEYHLQQMVISDDPIKYLGENM